MKLVIAIIQNEDANDLINALRKERIQCTKLASTGGFLSHGNTTVISGLEDDKVEECVKIIRDNCKTRTQPFPMTQMECMDYMPRTHFIDVQVGGATIFVVPVDKFEQF